MKPELNQVLGNAACEKRVWASFSPSFPFTYIKQLWLCLHSRFLDQETLYFGIVDTHESAWKSCWSSLSKINSGVFFLDAHPALFLNVYTSIAGHQAPGRELASPQSAKTECPLSFKAAFMSIAEQSCSNFILVLRTLFMPFVLEIKYQLKKGRVLSPSYL